ncbi:MAG TPA: hypothetical protein VNN07_09965 [Candidatus Tectomicrobia bacterium]|nr:hypothetical protein [Candidatus Tectomicrobia bacterium]
MGANDWRARYARYERDARRRTRRVRAARTARFALQRALVWSVLGIVGLAALWVYSTLFREAIYGLGDAIALTAARLLF